MILRRDSFQRFNFLALCINGQNVQLYITFPETITVQAPQVPLSQTRLAAVMSSELRMVSSRVSRGSTDVLTALPLS